MKQNRRTFLKLLGLTIAAPLAFRSIQRTPPQSDEMMEIEARIGSIQRTPPQSDYLKRQRLATAYGMSEEWWNNPQNFGGFPPLHFNCRCTTIPIENPQWGKLNLKRRRTNATFN